MTPKEIRLASGLTVEKAAVASGVTSPTLRLYEANTEAPSAPTRAKLSTFYANLAARLAAGAAGQLLGDVGGCEGVGRAGRAKRSC